MPHNKQKYDVVIIGAGAAGLMAGVNSGRRNRKTIILEHTSKIGEKIRISGGGRCNFTNIYASPANYISQNPHFIKSALANYTAKDFIKLVEAHNIAYHEKTLGQLFCDFSANQIIEMLVNECRKNSVNISTDIKISNIMKTTHFQIETSDGIIEAESLVIACGGLSIPKIGASSFGYDIAKQFNHEIIETRPALVPLILEPTQKQIFSELSGVSNASIVQYEKTSFKENILFTHNGLSGPAILQISSYLKNFDEIISINLAPNLDIKTMLNAAENGKKSSYTLLKPHIASRILEKSISPELISKNLSEYKKERLIELEKQITSAKFQISGSEGYKKAEVTAGGINTKSLSSKTMESKLVKNLFFIGEVVDVTGWLGGYNFQWAWSSGFAAGSCC